MALLYQIKASINQEIMFGRVYYASPININYFILVLFREIEYLNRNGYQAINRAEKAFACTRVHKYTYFRIIHMLRRNAEKCMLYTSCEEYKLAVSWLY